MKVAISANPGKPLALELARRCLSHLAGTAEVELVTETSEALGASVASVPHATLPELAADALIVIGGDGTFLTSLQQTQLPVLPINAGTVGYLSEVDGSRPASVEAALDRLVGGRYFVEERMKLASRCQGKVLPDATNEIVVHTSQVAKMRLFELAVDDHPLGRVRGDGVILATPTGSTSYSLSALGPIVDPSLEAIVITVLAPFQATQRAIVVDPLRSVSVRLVHPGKDGVIVVDGQSEIRVPGGPTVLAYRSARRASFIRFGSRAFGRLQGKRILPWTEEVPGTEAIDDADVPPAS
ncbi:MAG: NAD(+)/NADH kinase [Thermoplasmata archaeon]|nr:NAD(+)/NADH kinase [Thermoplasmata archaeon]